MGLSNYKTVILTVCFICTMALKAHSQAYVSKNESLNNLQTDSLDISYLLGMDRESLLQFAIKQAHLLLDKKGVKTTFLPKEEMKVFKNKKAIYVLINKGFYFSSKTNTLENYDLKIHFIDGKAFIFPEDYNPTLPKYKLSPAQQKNITLANIGDLSFYEDKIIIITDKDKSVIEYMESAALKHGGGAIAYSVNKTTKEKTMLWHEHVMPVDYSKKIVNVDTGSNSDDSEFIEFVNE